MKRSLTITVFIMLAAADLFAQFNPAKAKINGVIGLNATYAQVVKALGKPSSDGRSRREECMGGHEKTVKYAGLELNFMDGDSRGGKTFEVKEFDVTSPKWQVSGIRVGDSEAAVKAKLGPHYRPDKDQNGNTVWYYDMSEKDGPGTTTITFKHGKVAEISSGFQMC